MLLNTVNEPAVEGVQATVRTAGLGAIQAGWAFLWDGALKPLHFRQVSGAEVVVELPTTMQATLVLLNRCEPLVYPDVPSMAAAGTTLSVKARVLNLGPKSISGTVRWEVPAGWSAKPVAFGPVGSGQTVEVQTALVVGAGAVRRPYDLFCVAETAESSGRRYASVSVVPSPYPEWSWEPQGKLKVVLRNLEAGPVDTDVAVVLPPGSAAAVEPVSQRVGVPGEGTQEALFAIRGAETLQEAVGLRLVATTGERRQEVPVRLFPTIPNGGFEIDRAGDGKPEYWTTYDYSGKHEQAALYPLISLDRDRPLEGVFCLRVDPFSTTEDGEVNVYPIGSLLAPGTSYRVVAYLRVPAGGQGTLLANYQPMQPTGTADPAGWQRYEGLAGGMDTPRSAAFQIRNAGQTPIWVDAVSCTPVTP